jgi:RNA polymerase sigma factor (sigma-70 family)
MIFRWPVWNTNCDDSLLVSASLGGDRDAFAQIVRRYQRLVASITYSATGNLAESEDLAQETFVTAWRHLRSLREPGKLRVWLCGIARRATANALRRRQHEPAQAAASLEFAINTRAREAIPDEQAITREQEEILWHSLGQIPETYREPLILLYRENQSVERVARSLELSEEAVRQRLSRGRKLLEERVAAFVEAALRRSAPGPSFTLGVLGALPAQMSGLGAASAGVAAAKTGAATKAAAWLGLLGSLAGVFVGPIAAYLGFKTDMADAVSAPQRQEVKRFYTVLTASVLFSLGLLFISILARSLAVSHPALYSGLAITCAVSWIPPTGLLLLWVAGIFTAMKTANNSSEPGAGRGRAAYEYCSGVSLMGLPLIHIRFGGSLTTRHRPVKAWIAAGDIAVGGLLAAGGIAVAPLAIGGFVIGGLSLGGIGAGVLSYAGFALGVWAMGGLVVGLKALGGFALGWTAAAGGVAVARQFAYGGITVARHVGDAASQAYLSDSTFFRHAPALMTQYLLPGLILVSLPSILIWHAGRKKRHH